MLLPRRPTGPKGRVTLKYARHPLAFGGAAITRRRAKTSFAPTGTADGRTRGSPLGRPREGEREVRPYEYTHDQHRATKPPAGLDPRPRAPGRPAQRAHRRGDRDPAPPRGRPPRPGRRREDG